MCDLMKYFKYLFVFILTMFIGVITVNACTPSDCCTSCGQSAPEAACKAGMTSDQKAKCSGGSSNNTTKTDPCKSLCDNMPGSTACRQCRGENPVDNSNNGGGNNNGGGSNNGGGGSTPISPDMSVAEICKVCKGYEKPPTGDGAQEVINLCSEAGCPIADEQKPGVITAPSTDYKEYDANDSNLTGCEKVFGSYRNGKFTDNKSLGYFLQLTFNIIKYVVPIILIVLTSVDFLKGIAASDKEIIKVATGKLTKRAIIALAIFLIPTILNLILGLVTTYGTCGIK